MECETMENQTEMNKMWDEIGGGYVKLEKDKAKFLMLIDWNLAWIEKFKDEKGNIKKQIEFTAKVLSEDGSPVDKIFSTTSIGAIDGLKKILKTKDPKKPVLIRIKKMGEGKTTIYDVEEQPIKQ